MYDKIHYKLKKKKEAKLPTQGTLVPLLVGEL